jgi:hypothetical protein
MQAELAGRLPDGHREERGGQAAAIREEQDTGASLQPATLEQSARHAAHHTRPEYGNGNLRGLHTRQAVWGSLCDRGG